MNPALRWIATSLLAITGLAIAALVLVAAAGLRVDLSPLRDHFANAASEWLQRPVTIGGTATLAGGREPTLTLERVAVARPTDAGTLGVISIDKIVADLDIWQWLAGGNAIRSLNATGANILLVTADPRKTIPVSIDSANAGFAADGRIRIEMQGQSAGQPLHLTLQANPAGEPRAYALQAGFTLGGLSVDVSALSRAAPDPDLIDLDTVRIRFQDGDASASVAIDRLRLADRTSAEIATLTVSQLHETIRRDPNGGWRLVSRLQALPWWIRGPHTDPSRGGIRLQIATLTGTLGNEIMLSDADYDPPLNIPLEISAFMLDDLDSASPVAFTSITVQGTVDKRAPFDVSDAVADASGRQFLSGTLQALPLKLLTRYSERSGVRIDAGYANARLEAVVADGVVDGAVEIGVRDLSIAVVDVDKFTRLQDELPGGMQSNLQQLAGDDGTIRLSVPFRGHYHWAGMEFHLDLLAALQTALHDQQIEEEEQLPATPVQVTQ